MSLQIAAQHLASRGRGPDTALVHMAPSEVAGLQALAKAHGGSLTVNPDTGLPEAGFLSSILPVVLGAGLAATGVGAPMAAMLVGGGMTVATGSLQKGLMAGLGAFGGAGLGAGLMGAGSSALAAAPGAVAPEIAAASELAASQAAGAQNAITGLGVPSTAAAGVGNASFVPGGVGANMADILGTAPKAMGPVSYGAGAAGVAPVATATPLPTVAAPTALEKMGAGFSALGTEAGRSAALGAMGGGMGAAKYGLAALAPMALDQQQPAQYDGGGPNPYQFAFDWDRPSGPSYDSREALQLRGNLRPITAMAEGGSTDEKPDVAKGMTGASADALRYLMGQSATSPATQAAQSYVAARQPTPVFSIGPGTTTSPVTPAPTTASSGTGEIPTPIMNFNPATGQLTVLPPPPVESVTVPFSPSLEMAANGGLMGLAAGGQSHLGDYSDGGRLLRGPGDGVSDSIPATIADKRPARLADGEFVVPARIVSELGNGSTEAGARKLYAMMDRIQKARGKTVGKDRVAVNSRADKALPA